MGFVNYTLNWVILRWKWVNWLNGKLGFICTVISGFGVIGGEKKWRVFVCFYFSLTVIYCIDRVIGCNGPGLVKGCGYWVWFSVERVGPGRFVGLWVYLIK